MTTPNDYSENHGVRQFERRMLVKAFEQACEPGNHVEECARTNRHCPHREK